MAYRMRRELAAAAVAQSYGYNVAKVESEGFMAFGYWYPPRSPDRPVTREQQRWADDGGYTQEGER